MAPKSLGWIVLAFAAVAPGCAPRGEPPAEPVRGIAPRWHGGAAPRSVTAPMGVAPLLHAFESATRVSVVPAQARAEFEVHLDRQGRLSSIFFLEGDSSSWPRICRDVKRAIHAEPGAAVPAADLPLTMRLEVKSIPPLRARRASSRGSYEHVGPRMAQARVVSWSVSDGRPPRAPRGEPCS
jgi:hypothetical protein